VNGLNTDRLVLSLSTSVSNLEAAISSVESKIVDLETTEKEIEAEKPFFLSNAQFISARPIQTDGWMGGRAERHELLREKVVGDFSYAEDHIEQMLSDIRAKKTKLKNEITTMQNDILTKNALIDELNRQSR
jgi:prefoldin subunit 5